MKQQLEQLLKDAEEVTAKMREALAQMDQPKINMEHGKWYKAEICIANNIADWLFKFSHKEGAEWLIANHPEPFLVFFGVKS